MSIYDDMRDVAAGVMAEFKQGSIQYVGVTTTDGASPDESGSVTEDTPVTLNATARPVSTKFVDGTHIVQSDRQVTIPNDGKIGEPNMSGFIRIDGVDYKIIQVMPIPAAGDPISWTVIVRR